MDEIEQIQSQDPSRLNRLSVKATAVILSAAGIVGGLVATRGPSEAPVETPRIEQTDSPVITETPIETSEVLPEPTIAPTPEVVPTPESTATPEVSTGRIEKLKASQVLIYDSDGNIVCNGTKTVINGKPYVVSDAHCVTARDPEKYQNIQQDSQAKITGVDVSPDVLGVFEARYPDKPDTKITDFISGAIGVSREADILVLEAEPNPGFDAVPAVDLFDGEAKDGDMVTMRGQSLVDALENKPVREHNGTNLGNIDLGNGVKGKAVAIKLNKTDDVSIVALGRSGGSAASERGYLTRYLRYVYSPGDVKNVEEQEENGQEIIANNKFWISQIEQQTGKPVKGEFNFIAIYAEDKPEDFSNVAAAIRAA